MKSAVFGRVSVAVMVVRVVCEWDTIGYGTDEEKPSKFGEMLL